MSGGEASAPADATPPDFCARRSSLEVFSVCPRRFPLFALSLFLALLLVPSRALAYDFIPKGLVYSADLDGSRYGAVAVAANQFDAACYALGKEPASISTSMRSKLSDPNYGGRFYDFSQAFYTQGWPLEEVPEWLPIYVWGSLEWSDLLLSDYQSVWYVTCTQSLRSGALADFLAVLNGEDLSGGGSSETIFVSDYTRLVVSAWNNTIPSSATAQYNDTATNASIVDGVLVVGSGTKVFNASVNSSNYVSSGYVYLPDEGVSFCNDLISRGYKISVGLWGGVYAAPDLVSVYGTPPNGSESLQYLYSPSGSIVYFSLSGARQYYYDGKVFCFPPGTYNSGISQGSTIGPTYFSSVISSPISVPVSPPSGTWPEPSTPSAPVEPTFPDPATPTVQPDPVVTEPTVTWPSPTITINPDPVPGTTPTGLDYTELLTRINDNLISIDSFSRALNSNLNSLRSDLVNEFDGVVQGLRNIYTYLQHMDSVLERHCVHLQNKMEDVSVDIQNKMRELVHWLAEQLDFDSESSGNSDLFGILSTINDKLGGGTYEPNPLKDENAYYEWLDDLWDRFLLGDNWQNSASSMSQSFGQLTSRFPFSVPWDIVALFRLFVHDPVTPVFDLPLYYSSEDSATVRVDLSAWDGVASVVRPLVFVIFALKLALLSRHLLAGFGADKGGL